MRKNIRNAPAFFEVWYSNSKECEEAIKNLHRVRLRDNVLYIKVNFVLQSKF